MTYYFLAALGLRCCMCAFSSCGEEGLLSVACGLLIAVASLAAEPGFWVRGPQQLWYTGSVVVVHRLESTGSAAPKCELFADQESNLCPLHWQADSLPLSHQGSPHLHFKICVFVFFCCPPPLFILNVCVLWKIFIFSILVLVMLHLLCYFSNRRHY